MSIGKLRFHFTPSIAIPGRMPLVVVWLVLLLAPALISAQTQVFMDDFNRNQNPLGATGGTPTMTWTKTGTGLASTAQVSGSNYQLTIDNGSTIGRTFLTGSLSTFATQFNTTLSENKDDVIWTFNIRTARTSASAGFNNNQYAFAAVLAATSADLLNANGYAVTLMKGTAYNAVRLVKFSGGLDADVNLTTIVGPSFESNNYQHYFSVKVVYTPLTNTWKLYARNDLANASVDPESGELTQIGAATVDATYTNQVLSHCGFFINHGSNTTPASNKVNFDNFKVVVDNRLFTPAADITWSTPNWGQGTLTPGSNYDVRIPSNRKVTNTGTAASKMLH
ncbi:MAG: hypothetical protein RBT57_13210, partial [Paludibacter sp.]|nr:hypothetical protein [Paludibacter sp.]